MSTILKDLVPVPAGVVCTIEEYNTSDAVNEAFLRHCLTRGQTIGLLFLFGCGLVSFVAVLCMFVLIIRNARFYRRQKREAMGGSYYSLIEKPIDALLLSLFVADLIQSIGTLMSIAWVGRGQTDVGDLCTAQGVVKQLGETTVAMITSVIALYTLMAWYRGVEGRLRTAVYVVLAVWTLVIVLVIAGNVQYRTLDNPYSYPTPYWCWIGTKHTAYQIVGEYMWFWVALILSFIAYAILAWQDSGIQKHQIMAFPLVYAITIIPLTITRLVGFSRERHPFDTRTPTPSAAIFAVACLFNLGGLFNVALTYWLRKNSNLLHRRELEPVVDMDLSMMPGLGEPVVGNGNGNGKDKEKEALHASQMYELPREGQGEGRPDLKLHIV
ncbi:hypothetical protein AX16_006938 [Volvariella volvacea WC 439]|nr:hypothetical protein AX16_006938 [Volvariella volvacea WC 439]